MKMFLGTLKQIKRIQSVRVLQHRESDYFNVWECKTQRKHRTDAAESRHS